MESKSFFFPWLMCLGVGWYKEWGFEFRILLLTSSEIPPNHLKDVLNEKKYKVGPYKL